MSVPEVTAGVLVVDKPGGMTSHDVVARVRRLARTRRVGHAGTLDPMATGVLIVGVGQATRLLGHLALTDKEYDATICLGRTTTTDDAEGDVVEQSSGDAVAALTDSDIASAMHALTGRISQVPPAVSAIKVEGVRSYRRARSGETVELAARDVVVTEFRLLARSSESLDVRVACTTGTYIRALARDLGAGLGVGAHLTRLRRTRVGSFEVGDAVALDEVDMSRDLVPLSVAARAALDPLVVDADEALRLRQGQRRVVLPLDTTLAAPVAVIDPDGELVAVAHVRDGVAHPRAVFG